MGFRIQAKGGCALDSRSGALRRWRGGPRLARNGSMCELAWASGCPLGWGRAMCREGQGSDRAKTGTADQVREGACSQNQLPCPAPRDPSSPGQHGAGVCLTTALCWQLGQASQVETVSEENKSLMWVLLKQLRPGMDLSRVVLPTFVLEPRSFLDKLSDYYYHADLLSR